VDFYFANWILRKPYIYGGRISREEVLVITANLQHQVRIGLWNLGARGTP